MELREAIRRRRMVRAYEDHPVPQDVVDRILDHATRAPNAGFTQGWAFLVLDEPVTVERFWEVTTPPSRAATPSAWLRGMRTAPVVIVPMSSKDAYLDRYAEPDKGWTDRDEDRWAVPYWHVDAGMASLLALLTAVDEGLGACFFGIPPTRTARFREAFGVPDAFAPVGAITVGFPDAANDRATGSRDRGRRPVREVVHRGQW
ncbi:nitroreductase [Mumia flava]|uniref:Nitroreductase n=1 Tax=Mumia flava TaxID=1348852 RepID=A0A0B2BMR2_9ACTN|nr:nitroreductase family protein [Mumia flava]PJJ57957.1 nitroreductase [Mumia flava]